MEVLQSTGCYMTSEREGREVFDLRELERAHEIVGQAVPPTPAHAWPLLRDVDRLPALLERVEPSGDLPRGERDARRHGCLDEARRDGVHRHRARGQVWRHRLHQARDSCL